MTYEVELKAGLENREELERRAAEIGELVGETEKEDVYFRPHDNYQIAPTERYRLRREAGQCVVTFKEKVRRSGIEVSDEVEFTVDEAYSFFRFAHRFGFVPFVVKRKRSRVYQVGRAHVELNEVEHLGHFVEIEILCEQEDEVPQAQLELRHVLRRLGLSEDDLETRPYILLIQQAHPVDYRFISDSTLDWPFAEVPKRSISKEQE